MLKIKYSDIKDDDDNYNIKSDNMLGSCFLHLDLHPFQLREPLTNENFF